MSFVRGGCFMLALPLGAGTITSQKLRYENEFSIPSDIATLAAGEQVEVKVHRIIPDAPLPVPTESSPAAPLLELALAGGRDERLDGSERVDDYLTGDGT